MLGLYRQNEMLNTSPLFRWARVCLSFLRVFAAPLPLNPLTTCHVLHQSVPLVPLPAATQPSFQRSFHNSCLFPSPIRLFDRGDSAGWKSHQHHHRQEAPLHQPPACSQQTILWSTSNSALCFYSSSAFIDIHMLIQGEPSVRRALCARQDLWGRRDAHSGAAGRKPTRFSALRKQTNNYMSTMRRWTAINRCCSEEIHSVYRFYMRLFVLE